MPFPAVSKIHVFYRGDKEEIVDGKHERLSRDDRFYDTAVDLEFGRHNVQH